MERSSDLDLVRATSAPRDPATCRQVSGHAASIFVLIGEALIWWFVAWVAWSIPLTLAVLMIKGRFSDLQTAISLGLSGLFFVLSWVVFAWLVRRGRHAAQALVRDGVLVDGVIVAPGGQRHLGRPSSSATIKFSVKGIERHAVSGAARGEPGASVPILCIPGARRALAFPDSKKGRAVSVKVHSDIVIDRTNNVATVVFRRGYSETILAGIMATVLLELPLMVLGLALQHSAQLQCDRGKDTCAIISRDIFDHASPSYSFRISDVASSQVRHYKGDEFGWIAQLKNGHEVSLGSRTGDEAQARIYQQRSHALADFIANPAEPTLTMEFPAIGRMALEPLVLTIGVCAFFFFRWANAWRATLTFDIGSRTLTVEKWPALIPPARRKIPFASIARTEVAPGVLFLFYAAMATLRLRLYDANGKQLFGRWLITSQSATDEVKAAMDVLPR